jgi:hypothetical protein
VEIETAEEEEVGMSGEALDSRCRMLERLASEVSRLGYYATKGKVNKQCIFHKSRDIVWWVGRHQTVLF